jgi:hypothetical protein
MNIDEFRRYCAFGENIVSVVQFVKLLNATGQYIGWFDAAPISLYILEK